MISILKIELKEEIMLVAIINVHVKSDFIEGFKTASLDNASNSVKEPGVIRFDVYQQSDDPSRYTLVEIYKTDEDVTRHRETTHYVRWRDTVTAMMVEPRTRTTHRIVYPVESEW
jgi:(4S)-4-hydroxy-5-phosphonooxypentane-2,3-dione isomerase